MLSAVLVAMASTADAGWVFLDDDGQETLVSKGKMRSGWEDGAMIFDSSSDQIHLVDDKKKTIASGTVAEFCSEMQQMIEKAFEQVPPEQREAMKKMMGAGEPPAVEIVEKGDGGEVAGFKTQRYEVMADGKLFEEVWLARDEALMSDSGPVMEMLGRFLTCMSKVAAMGTGPSAKSSPEYAKLFALGVLVKTVDHAKGAASPNIVEITARDVSDDTFVLPAGYKSVSFASLWSM